MSASIEQAAANLAAALESGSAGDAESALASYAEAIEDVEDVPEADNGPLKHSLADLAAEQAEQAAEGEGEIVANEGIVEPESDEAALARLESEGGNA